MKFVFSNATLNGVPDIRDFSTSSWRNIIGVVPQVCHYPLGLPTTYQSLSFSIQEPVLFTGTIASNIAYGNSDATREQIEAAARGIGIAHVSSGVVVRHDRYPDTKWRLIRRM